MNKPATGIFVPKYPDKYLGDLSKPITYRSSWELSAMLFLDSNAGNVSNPNRQTSIIEGWASECFQIPYFHPFKHRWTMYVPDLFIVSIDKTGKRTALVLEIKPAKEVLGYQKTNRNGKTIASSKQDQMAQIVNAAKWTAAKAWCAKNNFKFQVATEQDLFIFKRK